MRTAIIVLGYPSTRRGRPHPVQRLRVQLEERAVSMWENVQFSIPLAEAGGAEQFVFASQPWHAARARRYLRRQRPDLSI